VHSVPALSLSFSRFQRQEEPKFAKKVRVPAEVRNLSSGSKASRHEAIELIA
jgi:hypothetical protein